VELLHELFPNAPALALLVNPRNPQTEAQLVQTQQAARRLGVELTLFEAGSEAEIADAFSMMLRQRVNAVIIGADSFFFSQHEQMVALAARSALPAIYPYREAVTAGGLMSYGTDLTDAYAQAGNYVGRILKGAKPSDLPIQDTVG
jgi:putative tryptophan/tyrosine transport system substrate-binding protein